MSTIRILQYEVFDGYNRNEFYTYGKKIKLNDLLATITPDDIYTIINCSKSKIVIIYWKTVPMCELCGGGIIDNICNNCNSKEGGE